MDFVQLNKVSGFIIEIEIMDLRNAIQTESLDTIKALVPKRGFTTSTTWLDYDALNIALKCGRKDVVEFLLQKKCRVNRSVRPSTDTPLHNAVQLADAELVSHLVENRASIVALDADGNSPLHLAFLLKQETLTDIMLDFIEKKSKFRNAKNSQGLTHLHIACTRNNAKVIEGFLKSGALAEDLTSEDSILWAGYNCFHFAAKFKSITAMKVLLRENTSQRLQARFQPNSLGQTPMQLINQQLEDLSIMASLMNSRGPSPFHLACVREDSQLLKNFLDNDVDPNDGSLVIGKFCPSYSPLHFATQSLSYENVELLLKYKADVDHRNKEDMTPVQLALYNERLTNNDKIIEMLYNAMNDKLNQPPDKNGLSFIHVACSMNDQKTIEKFLKKGWDVNSKVTYERQRLYHYTPLHFAIRYEHLELIKYLVAHGAEINCGEDCVDGTPLHLACKIGNQGIISFLLDNNADVKVIRSSDSKSTLHLLVECCLDRLYYYPLIMPYVSKLIDLGVDINAKDVNGDTVLHLTCSKIYYTECVKLLLESGADVNIENNAGLTPFDCQLASFYLKNYVQPGDYTILYHHVRKLMTLGLRVNPKNEACCQRLLEEHKFKWNSNDFDFEKEELAHMEELRIDAAKELKSIKLTSKVTLYEFLEMDLDEARNFVTNDALMEALQRNFPFYGKLLRSQYQKAYDSIGEDVALKRRRSE